MATKLLVEFISPRGRLARGAWAARLLALTVTALAFGMLALAAVGNDGAALVALFYLWCAGTLATRRLHDTGRSGASLLLFLIPALGALWLAALLLRPGAEGRNSYGADPANRLDYLQVDINA